MSGPQALLPASIAGLAVALALLFVGAAPALALRVVSWNLLNYPTADGNLREDDFRAVLPALAADVLVVQEITGGGSSGAVSFLANVLDVIEPGQWALAPFTNGPDTDNACYYRVAALDFVGEVTLHTTLRDITGFILRPDGYTASAAEIRLYSLHLKAGTGTTNESRRLSEAQVLRTHLNGLALGANVAVMGDFNIRAATEAAYVELTGSQIDDDGRVFDPISADVPGNWHNNSFYAGIHSQSTRTQTAVGGGSTGGSDDRFDMILVNDDLQDAEGLAYLSGSYLVFGQDGNHFNSAINALPTNAAVGQALADALHDASDHLPVRIDLQLPAKMTVSADLAFGSVLVGAAVQRTVVVENPAQPPADELDYTLAVGSGFSAPAGSFQLDASAGVALHGVDLDTSAPGARAATLVVSGDAPDAPSLAIPASATVLAHARPSTQAAVVVPQAAVDFGNHTVGAFSDVVVSVYNVGFGPLQAPLEVDDFQVTGPDASRFSVLGFSPVTVGAVPADFTLRFDDAGAAPNTTYTATLAFSTRDQPDLPGALDLGTISFELEAFVAPTQVAAPAALPASTRLLPVVPNPTNPTATVAFELHTAADVRLELFDARGRRLRTLLARRYGPGRHRLRFDGRDAAGHPLASGVYLLHFRAGSLEQNHRLTLVR